MKAVLLPDSIKHLSKLESLILDFFRLRSLPELPSLSVILLQANCRSLLKVLPFSTFRQKVLEDNDGVKYKKLNLFFLVGGTTWMSSHFALLWNFVIFCWCKQYIPIFQILNMRFVTKGAVQFKSGSNIRKHQGLPLLLNLLLKLQANYWVSFFVAFFLSSAPTNS